MGQNDKNNSTDGWTEGKLNGWLENNSPNGWTDGMNGAKTTRQMDGGMESKMLDPKNNLPKGWTKGESNGRKVTHQMHGNQNSEKPCTCKNNSPDRTMNGRVWKRGRKTEKERFAGMVSRYIK